MGMTAAEFTARLAKALGTEAPTGDEVDDLLALAAAAAHASERTAAPVACWLAARAGRHPREALLLARGIAQRPPAG
ncbi:MAG TPA: DUF6457 domain-containing protein [Acidimicrobiales bacterium]|nr:DUF6457 domain-containing protein [Acidimicrobiales bacterium]